MISVSPLSDAPSSQPKLLSRTAPRPPRGFRPAGSKLSNVRWADSELPIMPGRTVAQREGLKYERRVHDVLSEIYGGRFIYNSSILFSSGVHPRRAVPDGLLMLDSYFVVVEIKLTHTERAWWQLETLYAPLIRRLVVNPKPVRCVEICRNYDPTLLFPEPHTLIDSLHDLPPRGVGVLKWAI